MAARPPHDRVAFGARPERAADRRYRGADRARVEPRALALALVLELGRVHAALALSLAHDALFVITGVALALTLIALGPRGAVPRVAMVVGALFVGPVTFFRLGALPPTGGYSLFNYLTLSFRPHVVVAGPGILGF